MEEDYLSRLQAAMTTVRGINRTDVLIMGRALRSAAGIMQVGACPTGPWKRFPFHPLQSIPTRHATWNPQSAAAMLTPFLYFCCAGRHGGAVGLPRHRAHQSAAAV